MSKLVEMIEQIEKENNLLKQNSGVEGRLLGKKIFECIIDDCELYEQSIVIAKNEDEVIEKHFNWCKEDVKIREIASEVWLQNFLNGDSIVIKSED